MPPRWVREALKIIYLRQRRLCARTLAQQIDAARDCGMASLYTRAADRARLAKGAIMKLARTETAHSIPDRVPLRRPPPLVRLSRLLPRSILRASRRPAVRC